MQCFQKDANLRISAEKLLKHPWLRKAGRVPYSRAELCLIFSEYKVMHCVIFFGFENPHNVGKEGL